MSLPDVKLLKKLANECRKAGIKQFKSSTFEFTLTDEAPETRRRAPRNKKAAEQTAASSEPTDIEVLDMPDESELLFWSVGASEEQEMQ